MNHKTAARLAFSDMAEYNRENNVEVFTSSRGVVDVLVPTLRHVYTIESRRLNRELGVSSVNYGKNQYNTKSGYKSKKV